MHTRETELEDLEMLVSDREADVTKLTAKVEALEAAERAQLLEGVVVEAALQALQPDPGGTMVDCTAQSLRN